MINIGSKPKGGESKEKELMTWMEEKELMTSMEGH